MKIAHIIDGRVYRVEEVSSKMGKIMLSLPNTIDITKKSPQPREGWLCDYESKTFTQPPIDEILAPVRTLRNMFIAGSDYIELPSVWNSLTPEKQAEWMAYRQALRDITKTADPYNVVWPTPPSK